MQGQEQKAKEKVRAKKAKIIAFPTIPEKLYFSIGEVAKLCLVKPYVIRFWEQVFPQLKPAKLRCKRRYYSQKEVLLVRTIRNLLYEQGFTIPGARAQLDAEKDKLRKSNVATIEYNRVSGLRNSYNANEAVGCDYNISIVKKGYASNMEQARNLTEQRQQLSEKEQQDNIVADVAVEHNQNRKKETLKGIVERIEALLTLVESPV